MRRREADRELKRQKRAATRGAYRVANQQSLAVRRALEWIRASKARLVFRYEISDLLCCSIYNRTWMGRTMILCSHLFVYANYDLNLSSAASPMCLLLPDTIPVLCVCTLYAFTVEY